MAGWRLGMLLTQQFSSSLPPSLTLCNDNDLSFSPKDHFTLRMFSWAVLAVAVVNDILSCPNCPPFFLQYLEHERASERERPYLRAPLVDDDDDDDGKQEREEEERTPLFVQKVGDTTKSWTSVRQN